MNRKFLICGFMFSILFFYAKTLLAEEDLGLANAFVLFKKGAYVQTIEELDKIEKKEEQKAVIYYWKGLCYSKLQKYDEANANFKLAVEAKSDATDIYYEYGQALYATQDLENALKIFEKSYQNKFKEGVSLYYMGSIAQILEKNEDAFRFFKQIEKINGIDLAVRQATAFRIGEIIYNETDKRDDQKKFVRTYVIPQLNRAYMMDEKSAIAGEIKAKIAQIKEKYELGPGKMINGRPIPEKVWRIKFKENIDHDSNIIAEAEQPTARATYKDTNLFKTELSGRYKFYLFKRITTGPDLKLSHTYHTERHAPAIYQNDAYGINPTWDTTFEHGFFKGKFATTSFELDWNYQAKDNNMTHELKYYGTTTSFGIGEKMPIFSFGDFNFKYKYKVFKSHVATSDTSTHSFSFDEGIQVGSHIFLVLFSVDYLSAKNVQNSTDTYTGRVDYISPEILPSHISKLTTSAGFSLALLDPKLQKPTRGIEKMVTPSLKLTKNFDPNIEITGKYEYTKNYSKDKTSYQYNKTVYGIEFNLTF